MILTDISKGVFIIILSIVFCIWFGRDSGYVIDRQNRDPGGKPEFVIVPLKYRWLFKFQNKMYSDKYTILKASVAFHLLGYFFGIVETVVLVVFILTENTQLIPISISFAILNIAIGVFFIQFPDSSRYDRNMRETYDYDYITYYKQQLTGNSKRRCRIVSQIDEHTYEITIGLFGKKKFRAISDVAVNIGDMQYAVHMGYLMDDNMPYWKIKTY